MNHFLITLTWVAGLALLAYSLTCILIANHLTQAKRIAPSPGIAHWPVVGLHARGAPIALTSSFVRAEDSNRVVMLVHGRDSARGWELGTDTGLLATALQAHGFCVLLLDLRGHGQSGPARLTFGEGERLDVLGAVDWLRGEGFERIGVIGASMGAVSALLAAVEEPAIAAVVADSAFANLAPVLRAQFRRASGLPNIFLTGALMAGRWLTGERLQDFCPLERLGKLRTKVMLIHAKHDRFVPCQHALELAKALDANLWLTPSTSHLASYRDQPDVYACQVIEFLQEALGEQTNGQTNRAPKGAVVASA